MIDEVDKYSRDDEVIALYSAYSREELERNTLIKEAKEEAICAEKIEIAKNLLNENISIDVISKTTGLSTEEILSLRE